MPELRRLSEARLGDNERYARHVVHVAGTKTIADREEVPLEHDARKRMILADRELNEDDEADGDDEDADEEEKAEKKSPVRRRRNERPADDVVLDEAFQVLGDLIRLNGGRELPPAKTDWFNTILR